MHKHFTATAFIIHQERTLLLWHKRLKRWMPPGGHINEDETPADTAKRECKEETGLDIEIIGDESEDLFADCAQEGTMLKKPIAFLLENIPASEERGEPAHQHMDFLYIAHLKDDAQEVVIAEKEASDWRWFTKEEVQTLPEDSIFGNVKVYILNLL